MKNKPGIIITLLFLLISLSCRSWYFYEIQGGSFSILEGSNYKYQKSYDGVNIVLYAQAPGAGDCHIVMEISNNSGDLFTYKLDQLYLIENQKYFSIINIQVNGKYVNSDYKCGLANGKSVWIIFRGEMAGMSERSKEIELYLGKFYLSNNENPINIGKVLLTNLRHYKSSKRDN